MCRKSNLKEGFSIVRFLCFCLVIVCFWDPCVFAKAQPASTETPLHALLGASSEISQAIQLRTPTAGKYELTLWEADSNAQEYTKIQSQTLTAGNRAQLLIQKYKFTNPKTKATVSFYIDGEGQLVITDYSLEDDNGDKPWALVSDLNVIVGEGVSLPDVKIKAPRIHLKPKSVLQLVQGGLSFDTLINEGVIHMAGQAQDMSSIDYRAYTPIQAFHGVQSEEVDSKIGTEKGEFLNYGLCLGDEDIHMEKGRLYGTGTPPSKHYVSDFISLINTTCVHENHGAIVGQKDLALNSSNAEKVRFRSNGSVTVEKALKGNLDELSIDKNMVVGEVGESLKLFSLKMPEKVMLHSRGAATIRSKDIDSKGVFLSAKKLSVKSTNKPKSIGILASGEEIDLDIDELVDNDFLENVLGKTRFASSKKIKSTTKYTQKTNHYLNTIYVDEDGNHISETGYIYQRTTEETKEETIEKEVEGNDAVKSNLELYRQNQEKQNRILDEMQNALKKMIGAGGRRKNLSEALRKALGKKGIPLDIIDGILGNKKVRELLSLIAMKQGNGAAAEDNPLGLIQDNLVATRVGELIDEVKTHYEDDRASLEVIHDVLFKKIKQLGNTDSSFKRLEPLLVLPRSGETLDNKVERWNATLRKLKKADGPSDFDKLSKKKKLEYLSQQEGLEDVTIDFIPYLGVAKAAKAVKCLFAIGQLKDVGQKYLNDRIDHSANKMPTDPSTLGHLFRNKEGHFTKPSEAAKKLLLEVARNKNNYLGKTEKGVGCYAKREPDGSQIWVEVNKGSIRNGGINAKVKPFNFKTGFKALTKPVKGGK